LPITVIDVSQLAHVPEIAEEGRTFLANASAKAQGVARASGSWTLAEDSGLVVPALGGEPGVDSALYAGTHGNDQANNAKLIERIGSVAETDRGAFYVCVAVLCNPHGEIKAVSEGRCHGVIVPERHGTGGFGYDPLFLIPEYHRTFGQLSSTVKAVLSHRSKAITLIRPAIMQYVASTP